MKNIARISTQRELNILKYISDMEYAEFQTIHRKFFPNCKQAESASRCLRKLVKNKLLRSISSDMKTRLFFVARQGVDLLRTKFPEEVVIDEPRLIKINYMNHIKDISEIRADLEKFIEVKRWKSDRYLAAMSEEIFKDKKVKYIPDGIVTTSDGELVFEYERTLKSAQRIKDKIFFVEDCIDRIQQKGLKAHGLIVTSNDGIKNRFKENVNTHLIKVFSLEEIREGAFSYE